MNYHNDLKEKKFSIFVLPQKMAKTHTHNFLELVYVLKGDAIHKWDKTEFKIKEGDFFVINFNSEHSYISTSEEFQIINCLFLPEFIDPTLRSCNSFQAVISSYQIHFKTEFFTANPSMYVFQDNNHTIKDQLLAILSEFNCEAPGYMHIIRSKLVEILVMTMRKIYLAPALESNNNEMSNIIKYLNLEYMNNITLQQVCELFNYSYSHLSLKFKKELGMSFTEYMQKLKIEHSMRLLVHTDKSISEIIDTIGYKDIKSFYTLFKRIANTTPASFRKNNSIR